MPFQVFLDSDKSFGTSWRLKLFLTERKGMEKYQEINLEKKKRMSKTRVSFFYNWHPTYMTRAFKIRGLFKTKLILSPFFQAEKHFITLCGIIPLTGNKKGRS